MNLLSLFCSIKTYLNSKSVMHTTDLTLRRLRQKDSMFKKGLGDTENQSNLVSDLNKKTDKQITSKHALVLPIEFS